MVVIYEDNHLLAVHKPAGILVHADVTGDESLSDVVKEYIRKRYGKPGEAFLGVIHRIDRPVSGVVLFAKTTKALQRMNEMFKNREVQKTYLAITEQRPAELEEELIHYLIKDEQKNIARASISARGDFKHGKLSHLKYKLIASLGDHHLLEVMPYTGRPHQIRCQLGKIECPIRGDLKYGAQRTNFDGNICLHAYSLSFMHPVKKEPVTIKAKPPKDQVWGIFKGMLPETVGDY